MSNCSCGKGALVERLTKAVKEYENTLSWHTCCPMDAERLSQLYEAQMEADELREKLIVAEQALTLYKIRVREVVESETEYPTQASFWQKVRLLFIARFDPQLFAQVAAGDTKRAVLRKIALLDSNHERK